MDEGRRSKATVIFISDASVEAGTISTWKTPAPQPRYDRRGNITM